MTNGKRSVSLLGELSLQCMDDSTRWFGDSAISQSIVHHTLAMCGETGEFANLIKKIERGSLDGKLAKTRYDLAMELADVFTYLLNIAGLLQVDLLYTYIEKRRLNEARFSEQRREREEAEQRKIAREGLTS